MDRRYHDAATFGVILGSFSGEFMKTQPKTCQNHPQWFPIDPKQFLTHSGIVFSSFVKNEKFIIKCPKTPSNNPKSVKPARAQVVTMSQHGCGVGWGDTWCEALSFHFTSWAPFGPFRGVLLGVWPGPLWPKVFPIQSIDMIKSFLIIPLFYM